MKLSILLITVCVILMGCSTARVIPMGPDTYTITDQSMYGVGAAKRSVLEKANAYAASQGKYMIPINVSSGFNGQNYYYDLIFRIVDKSDSEYQRTNLQKAPDILIENK